MKGIIVQTNPNVVDCPFAVMMGNLSFFPPSTEARTNGLHFWGADTITLVVGPPDAAWEFVNDASPPIGGEEGVAMQSERDIYYRLSVP